MARVFTITEGLENLGALKTGGQGSVYKGKRLGEIFTAIKILPTPIYSESADDKNFISFKNEVAKLKKVNEVPNPNVVAILNSGITDSGNFPFIEMEFIEGPDLGELLMPPNAPIFETKEIIKVAMHVANALAHCHKAGVKHGDIKSNNIKFNNKTGNYMVLDFGLSVMSDEQRRTSFRRAGAVEFMAPEQNEGHMYFQTDVYSFGVILFELIAGTVPFPLSDKGETARNHVMLAHIEQGVPDALDQRHKNLPADWSDEKKAAELALPEWLLTMVYICLQKQPENRFANGMQLHDYVWRHTMGQVRPAEAGDQQLLVLRKENERLRQEKAELQEMLERLQETVKRQPVTATAPPAFSPAYEKQAKTGWTLSGVVSVLIPLLALGVLVFLFLKYNNPFKETGANTPQQQTLQAETTTVEPPRIITSHRGESIEAQLRFAAGYVKEGNYEAALSVYRNLAQRDIPEAMYNYGNLALQNLNHEISCKTAIAYIDRAAKAEYVPAKTTLGFVYAFADDADMLRQNGYEACDFRKDITKGSRLLMEAMIAGDSTAGLLLNELNTASQPAADSTVQ